MLFALLFFLLAAHALMDYALQSGTIAACKCRGSDHPVARTVPWYYWLVAHAVLHGTARLAPWCAGSAMTTTRS